MGSTDERIGTVLSERYRLDELLGEGGMGKVYAAEHVMMKKKLAVKVLHRELSTVPEVLARFEREAMAAANIDHPNVATATDFGKLPDGSVFLVLEFVEGRSLRDEIAAGPMPVERALHIARQVAAALGSAHALGIVHRDLKPENVMLVTRGADSDFVKVLDFGIAKVPHAAKDGAGPLTKAGMVFGTPEYMAPEQALAQSVDGRADLYSLGVMTFEMLSGVRPFPSNEAVGILGQQLSKGPPSIAERAPAVRTPVQAEQIVQKLLAKDASARYQTADEVVSAIEELLAPPPGKGGQVFTQAVGSPTAFLGSREQVYGSKASATKTGAQKAAPTPAPAPASLPKAPPRPGAASVAAVISKPTFLPSDPLPSFTLPAIDRNKLPLPAAPGAAPTAAGEGALPPLSSVPTPAAATAPTALGFPSSTVDASGNKPTFLPSDPLPAFTFPPLDERKAAELAASVAQAQAAPLIEGATPLAPGIAPDVASAGVGAAGAPAKSAGVALARAREVAVTALRRGRALTQEAIRNACTFIDANRSRLPARVQHALQNVRAGVILAVLVGLIWTVLVLCMVLFVGGSRSDVAKAPSEERRDAVAQPKGEDPVLREIDAAKSQGHAALEKLADKHPEHGRVLLALAASHASKANHAAAVSTLEKALTADPKLNEDPAAADLLAAAVRRDATNAAFTLLDSKMGAAGATVLYDLSIDQKVKAILRTRAETWIRSDKFEAAASPDVAMAGALRYARSCQVRHSLLVKAGEVGEQRTLDYLNVMKVKGGCGRRGRDDCFACVRRDDALKTALALVEKRVANQP